MRNDKNINRTLKTICQTASITGYIISASNPTNDFPEYEQGQQRCSREDPGKGEMIFPRKSGHETQPVFANFSYSSGLM